MEASPLIINERSLTALVTAGMLKRMPSSQNNGVVLNGHFVELKRSDVGHKYCNVMGLAVLGKCGLTIDSCDS